MPNTLNRIKIAKSFDSATDSYDVSARLQRFSGKHLLPLMPNRNDITVLDLGCGTGFFTELLASTFKRVIGVDISSKMLQFTQENRDESIQLVAGDAYKMPFADNSIDCIYSNLVIQWCNPLEEALEEIFRVLKPGGLLIFSTLVDGTLFELKSSWRQVDDDQHVIDFRTPEELERIVNTPTSSLLQSQVDDVILEYENPMHLAHELKGLGANHLPNKKIKGLAGKDKWKKMMESYQDFLEPGEIYPATYKVFSGLAVKLND
ncbi:malonyl-ACP O-methyltransferase BioC [Thalassotalea atypica]|uniref:malonyl-ACP O-methyltransferase BioC n=1 Tax=Thalassotalea atypica TaxID=2054316 RepID=UPI002572D95F|nr:malonyl-ACP O-methyltransferase BioC [Thalassotalea atypica]